MKSTVHKSNHHDHDNVLYDLVLQDNLTKVSPYDEALLFITCIKQFKTYIQDEQETKEEDWGDVGEIWGLDWINGVLL